MNYDPPRRTHLFFAVLIVALAAGLALAERAFPASMQEIHRAQSVAADVHRIPMQPIIQIGALTNPPPALAEAPWNGCVDIQRGCYVRLDPAFVRKATWDDICSVMTHEYGHLSGWLVPGGPDGGQHSADPKSNMYAEEVHHPACGLSDKKRGDLEDRADDIRAHISVLAARTRALKRVGAWRRARAVAMRTERFRRLLGNIEMRLI